MLRRAAAALLALALLGCEGDETTAITGTTIRVGRPEIKGQTNYALRVFASEEDCGKAESIVEAEREACLPYVDRATGTVQLSFQLLVDQNPTPMTLRSEAVTILHDKSNPNTNGDDRVQIIPHQETSIGSLYVLLIDGSGSMGIVDDPAGGLSRMEKLRRALLRKDVLESFYSGGNTGSAVAPLVFRGGLPTPLGGKWVVEEPKEYQRLIRDELQVGSGYTYLYQAVKYAANGLAEQPEVKRAVLTRGLSPTIIALTDGFNNESPSDTCGDNAPRLQALLDDLTQVRLGRGVGGYQPDVFTVGLGRRAWKKFKVPDQNSVSPGQICKRWASERIDGNVENLGVDNAALDWIARVGGGDSFVRSTPEGLAEAFLAAARKRHMWFQVRYKVDPFYLRRGFTTTIRMTSPYQVETSVTIYPSAWLDGPPGVPAADGWPRAQPYRASLVVVMSILSVLVALNYLPAAFFNVRRALFGLLSARKR
jgi:hypothetical protein